jgi:hypothetical protein
MTPGIRLRIPKATGVGQAFVTRYFAQIEAPVEYKPHPHKFMLFKEKNVVLV